MELDKSVEIGFSNLNNISKIFPYYGRSLDHMIQWKWERLLVNIQERKAHNRGWHVEIQYYRVHKDLVASKIPCEHVIVFDY